MKISFLIGMVNIQVKHFVLEANLAFSVHRLGCGLCTGSTELAKVHPHYTWIFLTSQKGINRTSPSLSIIGM